MNLVALFPEALKLLDSYDGEGVSVSHMADHVRRMLGRIPTLQTSEVVPPKVREMVQGRLGQELEVVVLLHNLDRTASAFELFVLSMEERDELVRKGSTPLLEDTDFTEEERKEIMTAVLEHSKLDGTDDSLLLKLLRFLDRWDRFSMSGILGMPMSYSYAGLYPKKGAFAARSTREADIESGGYCVSHVWRRVVEWIQMMPDEWMRELARPEIEHALFTLRWFAEEIAADPGTEDVGVEAMLREALGEHYAKFPPQKLVPV
ncbi:MAG: hypothetical protein Q8R20_01310 [Nanoarchaeota archaeon]|nr:hypothetical protein [Nanoarchaeota archaeon]